MNKTIAMAAAAVYAFLTYTVATADETKVEENITCEQTFELIKEHEGDTNFVIIDFRPIEKYKNAYLENAVFYDVFRDDVDEWLDALDRNKTYLIYCTIGHRSGIALEKMRGMGFRHVFHMYQGVRKWKELGYKTLAVEN